MSRPISKNWARLLRRAVHLAAAGLGLAACILLLLFAPFALSADLIGASSSQYDDEDLVQLRDYVASIDGGPVLPISYEHSTTSIAGHEFADPDYAALREFVLHLEGDQARPAPTASPDRTKLAQADNALDALREWFQNRDAPPASKAPTASPKGLIPETAGAETGMSVRDTMTLGRALVMTGS
jgi:hypothetical protein